MSQAPLPSGSRLQLASGSHRGGRRKGEGRHTPTLPPCCGRIRVLSWHLWQWLRLSVLPAAWSPLSPAPSGFWPWASWHHLLASSFSLGASCCCWSLGCPVAPCLVFLYFCLFIFGCTESLLLPVCLLELRRAGAALGGGVRASHCDVFSYRRPQALGVRAQ